MRTANIGTRIATVCAIGKVSPSEYKYSFQLPATIIKSENAKERMLQNSDFKKALPEYNKARTPVEKETAIPK